MERYGDYNGTSGIKGYEIFEDRIDIEFANGGIYTYLKANIGEVKFSAMKALADAGRGLNAFINKYVRNYGRRAANAVPSVEANVVRIPANTTEALEIVTYLMQTFDVEVKII